MMATPHRVVAAESLFPQKLNKQPDKMEVERDREHPRREDIYPDAMPRRDCVTPRCARVAAGEIDWLSPCLYCLQSIKRQRWGTAHSPANDKTSRTA